MVLAKLVRALHGPNRELSGGVKYVYFLLIALSGMGASPTLKISEFLRTHFYSSLPHPKPYNFGYT